MATERYGEAMAAEGGRIATLVPGGAIATSGIEVGDIVREVDDTPVADILDWQWYTAEDDFIVTIERDGELFEAEVERIAGSPLGVEFEGVVFDEVRQCMNSCAFCFVAQLPAGLRPALYVRDDDYRLSFLHGNFITLTNLTEHDMARIAEQHLSPLHISLHAVDEDVRSKLVCPTVEDTTLDRIDELTSAGIEIHVQIVLVPGVNDGEVLERSLAWLSGRDGVLSVGIVPLGYTAHQKRFERSFTSQESRDLVRSLGPWQQRMRAERGIGWVYAADEFYLAAGETIPVAEEYDDFPQYENGIGLVRAFIDEFTAADPIDSNSLSKTVLVTGTLFAPVLAGLVRDAGLEAVVRILPVTNRFFGGNVSVTGLLAGGDIADAIREDASDARYFVPDIVVNSDGLLLDDVPAGDLISLTGARVQLVGPDAAALTEALAAPA
jgi:putative radical SAM enzyme (TIGR03279 family)